MGMPEWSAEANRLLDAWAEAACNERVASKAAREAEDARAALADVTQQTKNQFDKFMSNCARMRAEAMMEDRP